MSGDFKVTSAEILNIAGEINSANGKLQETLQSGMVLVEGLVNFWKGAASTETIEGFKSFVEKYSQIHYRNVETFATFLVNDVAETAALVEQQNTPQSSGASGYINP
jgi:uncharacterized protein YukE